MNQRKMGAVLSYVNIFLSILVGLVYTPIMLRLLGQSEYGLYSLIGSFVSYLSVLDLGLGNTIIRYTARNRAIGDKRHESELNGLFLLVYSCIGFLTIIIGGIFYTHIDDIFGAVLDAAEMDRARIMMILLVFNFSSSFPLGIFGSIIQAYERFVFLRVINIIRVLLNPCIVIPLLFRGYGSVMMVIISTLLNISCLLVTWWYALVKLQVHFSRGKFEKTFLLEIAGYSLFIFLNAIMDKVYWGTGQFVLGVVSGTMDVAIYAIAMQFMLMYMQFSNAISGVLLPQVTVMVAECVKVDKLTSLMIKIGRLQYLIIGYILSMFLLLGRSFLYLWAGEAYMDAYPMVLLLMFSMFIPLVQNTGIAILQAMNLNRYRMTMYSLAAVANIIVCVPLAKTFAGMGCAIATSLALFVSTGYVMNRYYYKKIGIDIFAFWKNISRMAFFPSLLVVVLFILDIWLSCAYTWTFFIAQAMGYSLLYALVVWSFSMNSYEKNFFYKALSKLTGGSL